MTRRQALTAVVAMAAYSERTLTVASPQAQQQVSGLPPSLVILDGRPVVAVVQFRGQRRQITADELWNALTAKEST